jgi:hypothetical protein
MLTVGHLPRWDNFRRRLNIRITRLYMVPSNRVLLKAAG